MNLIIPCFGLESLNVCLLGRFHVSQAANLPSLYFLSIYQTGRGADITLAISLRRSVWEQTWRWFQLILMINYMKATLIHLQCRITSRCMQCSNLFLVNEFFTVIMELTLSIIKQVKWWHHKINYCVAVYDWINILFWCHPW